MLMERYSIGHNFLYVDFPQLKESPPSTMLYSFLYICNNCEEVPLSSSKQVEWKIVCTLYQANRIVVLSMFPNNNKATSCILSSECLTTLIRCFHVA